MFVRNTTTNQFDRVQQLEPYEQMFVISQMLNNLLHTNAVRIGSVGKIVIEGKPTSTFMLVYSNNSTHHALGTLVHSVQTPRAGQAIEERCLNFLQTIAKDYNLNIRKSSRNLQDFLTQIQSLMAKEKTTGIKQSFELNDKIFKYANTSQEPLQEEVIGLVNNSADYATYYNNSMTMNDYNIKPSDGGKPNEKTGLTKAPTSFREAKEMDREDKRTLHDINSKLGIRIKEEDDRIQ